MVNHNHHKLFIGITSILILILGLILGFYWARDFQLIDFQVVNLGVMFVIVILLLLVGSLVLDLKDAFQLSQKRRGKK